MRLKLAILMLVLCTFPAVAAGLDRHDLRAIRQACSSDIRTLCAGVGRGQGRIAQCMKAHASAVSPGCTAALKAIEAKLQSAGRMPTLYDTD